MYWRSSGPTSSSQKRKCPTTGKLRRIACLRWSRSWPASAASPPKAPKRATLFTGALLPPPPPAEHPVAPLDGHLLLLARGLDLGRLALPLQGDVREDAVHPLRQPPGAIAQQGDHGRGDDHPDDQHVDQD